MGKLLVTKDDTVVLLQYSDWLDASANLIREIIKMIPDVVDVSEDDLECLKDRAFDYLFSDERECMEVPVETLISLGIASSVE